MVLRLVLFCMFFFSTLAVSASERLLLNFKLTQDKNPIEAGSLIVSNISHTWNKGLKRSYLKLRCNKQESGAVQKLYSTIDHFAGLRVTHQIVDNHVLLTVIRDAVKPRLAEIRALAKNECVDLAPIVTTVNQNYRIPVKENVYETFVFSEKANIQVNIQALK